MKQLSVEKDFFLFFLCGFELRGEKPEIKIVWCVRIALSMEFKKKV